MSVGGGEEEVFTKTSKKNQEIARHGLHLFLTKMSAQSSVSYDTRHSDSYSLPKHFRQHHSLPMFSSPSPGLPRNDGSFLRMAVLRPASSSPSKLCSLGSIPLLHFLSSNSSGAYTWQKNRNPVQVTRTKAALPSAYKCWCRLHLACINHMAGASLMWCVSLSADGMAWHEMHQLIGIAGTSQLSDTG